MYIQSLKRQRLFREIFGIFGLVLLCTSAAFAQGKIKIGIMMQTDIKPFLEGVEGAKKVLAEKGYTEDKVEYITFNAKGNVDSIKDAVDQMRKADVKVILTTGTNGAIETLKYIQDIPVVFSVVSYAESVIEAGKKFGYGNNYTGALISTPAEKLIDVALKIKRDIGKVGMLYNSNEDNSRRDKDNFEKGCRKFGIESVAMPYTGESELLDTFQKLVDQGVKSVLIPKDTVQVKHADELKSIIYKNQLFSMTTELAIVPGGSSVFGLSSVPYNVGRLAGEKIAEILNGKKPADIPIEGLKSFDIWVNMAAAAKVKIDVPTTVLKLASKVITE